MANGQFAFHRDSAKNFGSVSGRVKSTSEEIRVDRSDVENGGAVWCLDSHSHSLSPIVIHMDQRR